MTTRNQGNMTIRDTLMIHKQWEYGNLAGYKCEEEPIADDIVAYLLDRPAMAWEVLQTLAGKVAGPWEYVNGEWNRKYMKNDDVAAYVELNIKFDHLRQTAEEDGYNWAAEGVHMTQRGRCRTVEDAKAAADAALRKTGYVLVDDVEEE